MKNGMGNGFDREAKTESARGGVLEWVGVDAIRSCVEQRADGGEFVINRTEVAETVGRAVIYQSVAESLTESRRGSEPDGGDPCPSVPEATAFEVSSGRTDRLCWATVEPNGGGAAAGHRGRHPGAGLKSDRGVIHVNADKRRMPFGRCGCE